MTGTPAGRVSELLARALGGTAVIDALLAQIPTGLVVAGADGRVLFANDAARRLTGSEIAQVDGVATYSVDYTGHRADGSEYAPEEWPLSRALLHGEHVRDEEIDVRLPDGQRRWFSVSAAPVRDADGTIVAGVAALTDITERHRAESVMRASEHELTDALESMSDAFFAYDHAWHLVRCNGAARQWILDEGIDPDQAIGRVVWEALPDLATNELGAALRRVAQQRRPEVVEIRTPNSSRWVEAHLYPTESGVVSYSVDVTARRLAYSLLAEEEERYRRLADAGVVGVMFWSIDGRILDANEEFLRIFGYERADLEAGHIDWRRMTPPEWEQDDAAKVAELFATGRHGGYEKEYFHRDGRRVRVVVGSAFFEGSRERGVSFVLDVTDRRRALARAEALQAVTNALVAARTAGEVADAILRIGVPALGASRASVAVMLPDARTLEVIAQVGYDGALAARWRRVPIDSDFPLAESVRDGVPLFLATAEERDRRYPHLAELRRANGDGAMACVPLDAGTSVLGALGFNFPAGYTLGDEERALLVTFGQQCAQALERARLDEAERRARALADGRERRARFLADTSRMLAATLDYEQTLQAVARAAVPELGDWCAIDMLREPRMPDVPDVAPAAWPPVVDRLAVEHESPERVAWARELAERQPTDWSAPTGLARVVREGASEFYPEITDELLVAAAKSEEELALLREIGFSAFLCVPLLSRGRVLGAITLAMTESRRRYDAADLALAEDLARRAATAVDNARLYRDAVTANRAKSDFLAVMSHELRTPLNAILGYAGLLDAGVAGDLNDGQRDFVLRGRDAARRLLSLVEDVLAFAKLEAGRVSITMAAVPVRELVASATAVIALQASARDVTLRVVPAEARVIADRERAGQVLLNLLSNAIKFTPAGGTVEVRASTPGDAVAIHVRDTGVGIPASEHERIFEPFVQVDPGLTRTSEGTGLGLAISRELARAMGGDVTLVSEPGLGSTFTLVLPAAGGETG